jgi:uncharacterized protein (TIGR00725 family)
VSRRAVWIAVIGAGDTTSAQELETAEDAGATVAGAGAILVCGGLGGVMQAACRGARSCGGVTVGILPGGDRDDANGWVTVALPTGLGEARNVLVVRAADAVVAIGGGWGTLSEIALAGKLGRPVAGVGSWKLSRGGIRAEGPREAVDGGQAVRWALEQVGHGRQDITP